MDNKIDLNVEAETEEEVKIEKFLDLLHSSTEIKQFLNEMQEEADKWKIYKYRARIKDAKSAIRTYRINGKTLDEAHDYIGISFITDTEDEIYPIIDYFKNRFKSAEYIDFVKEDMIYSPLVYIKWVPPLGYNVFAKEALIPNERLVPIEIRVCSKEGYISEQSAYYSVQKNDTLKIPIEERQKLRNLVQHITYKFALLSIREMSKEERDKHRLELDKIISENHEFLVEHMDLCEDVLLDCGKLIYTCGNKLL